MARGMCVCLRCNQPSPQQGKRRSGTGILLGLLSERGIMSPLLARTCQIWARLIAEFRLARVGAQSPKQAPLRSGKLGDGAQGLGKEMKLDLIVTASSRRAARAI